MRNRRWLATLLVALMLLALLLAALLPAMAHAAPGKTLRIDTAREFIAFAGACVYDDYSSRLTVYLDADIDLSGEDAPSVPIFLGIFEGNGHTIGGLDVSARGSEWGLFRRVAQGAVIRNLTVEGIVAPTGSQMSVGLLAGLNEGEIVGCAVYGEVTGIEEVGGVAGLNHGAITHCENHATITGDTYTGGIAGRNTGTIVSGTNRGAVNARSDASFTDAGGIAGRSAGRVAYCANYGEVGAPHNGYNVGGIVGLSGDSVLNSANYGPIRGRKDVGGIVGQADPIIDLEYEPSPTEQLGEDLAVFFEQFQQLADELNRVVGDGADDLRGLHESIEDIRRTAGDAIEVEADEAQAVFDDVSAEFEAIGDALEKMLEDTDAFREEAAEQLAIMGEAIDEARLAIDDAADDMGDALGDAEIRADALLASLEADVDAAVAALRDLGDQVDDLVILIAGVAAVMQDDTLTPDEQMAAIYDLLDDFSDSDMAQTLDNLTRLLEGIAADAGDLAAVLQEGVGAVTAGIGRIWSAVDACVEIIGEAAGELGERFMDYADEARGHLEVIGGAADRAGERLGDYVDKAGTRLDRLGSELEASLDAVDRYLYSLGDTVQDANDSIHGIATGMITQMDTIRETLTSLGKTPELTIDDTSDDAMDNARGRIEACRNYAAVEGDVNVGGIAGNVGYELNPDPEEDWDLGNVQLVDTRATVYALLRDCRNDGGVLAKTECAGGIVGRADIGAVIACVQNGAVSVTNSSHCGGIVGMSNGTVRDCFALADLTGNDYVGGVAGKGEDISGCYAMIRIDSDGEKLGAIAGETTGEVKLNFFLNEGLTGIEGVNYRGKAVPLSYAAFAAAKVIPEDLLDLRVEFVADGEVIRSVQVPYGGSLDEAEIPACPPKEDFYARWEAATLTDIVRAVTIEALYLPWTRTASSGGDRPTLLAEGEFCPDVFIEASPSPLEGIAVPPRHTASEAWDYAIGDERGAYGGRVRLHVRVSDERGGTFRVGVVDGAGGVTVVDAESDGSYLVFEADGSGRFVILRESRVLQVVLASVGGAVLAALIVLVIVLLRRRHKRLAQEQGGE